MSNMRMKHKLIMSMMAGAIMIPGSVVRTQAAETDDSEKSLVPVTGIENILEASYQTEIKNNINLYLVPTEEGEYLNIAFSDTDDFTYVRSEPDENSDWTGKLYKDSTVEVLEYLDGWNCDISGCRKPQELPQAALEYIRFIEQAVGCKIRYVSVGAEREQYIEL